jgi:hypothetical protein
MPRVSEEQALAQHPFVVFLEQYAVLLALGQHILSVKLPSMGAGWLAGGVQQPVLPSSCLHTVEPTGQQ